MSIHVKLFAVISIAIIVFLSGWQGIDAGSIQIAKPASATQEPGEAALRNNRSASTDFFSFADPGPRDSSLVSDHSTLSARQSWALGNINATGLNDSLVGSPVLVAVLDTGIDITHEELIGKVALEQSFVEGCDVNDILGHGTFIAGIIAADDDNGTGIAGLAPDCYLLNGKVADDKGLCRESDLIEGIYWAIEQGAKIINISIELSSYSSRLADAIKYAADNDAIIIAAAGNEGCSTPAYPAALDNCVAVTGIRQSGTLAPLANYGDWVDAAAPGYDIYGILPDDEYGYQHGTSFATAYVSGLAARLYMIADRTSENASLSDEVLDALFGGCRKLQIEGTGYGIIDIAASQDILFSQPAS